MKNISQVILFLSGLFFSINLFAQVGAGNAYNFSGDYIAIPNSASLSPTSEITVEAWIKADSWDVQSWENVIVSKDGWSLGNQGYTLRAGANGTLSFNLAGGSNWYEVVSSPIMETGKWYHVAGTFDGTELRVYINGLLVGSSVYVGTINQGSYDVRIGDIVYSAGGARDFDGMIDEVRIWSTALPQSSIQEFMCKHVTVAHPQYASLEGYWKFDAAGTVVDDSGNGNDGTVSGAALVPSGAAIGDESVFSYSGTVDLSLDYMGMDSVNVQSTTADVVHLYRVDGSSPSNGAGGVSDFDDTHYYGVFSFASSGYSYDATYYYGASPFFLGNESMADLATRNNGELDWMPENATMNTAMNTFSSSFSDRTELISAIVCDIPVLNVSGASSICDGDTLEIVDSGNSAVHQWYDANGPIAGETNPSFNAVASGDYFVVVNSGVCTDSSDVISLTVNPVPDIDFGATPTSFCENDSPYLLNLATPSGGLYLGAGVASGKFNPALVGVGNTMIYYQVASLNGCIGKDSLEVVVNPSPATPLVTQNGMQLCASPGGTSYNWYINGVLSSVTSECIDITTNGTYEVALVNAEGCASPSGSFIVANAGLDEDDLNLEVNVVPNPTNGVVTLFVEDMTSDIFIRVYSLEGKCMLQKSVYSSQMELDLSNLPKGVYLLSVSSYMGEVVKRVVKQ